jgi:two-component system, chemotaxis family, chemotaxis protein CheY
MTNAILVVDDAATVRMYHRSILEKGDFSVAEAANGYEALEVTLQRRFDLMLVDVNMPRMDGYTFVESVREAGLNRETPIVMISTEDGAADMTRGYVAGANAYLTKPVAEAKLLRLARLLCQGPA